MTDRITKEEIVQLLSDGWELANRGTGWWISSPRIPYKKSESRMVCDILVAAMESEGIIKLELPYNTYFARLAPQKA